MYTKKKQRKFKTTYSYQILCDRFIFYTEQERMHGTSKRAHRETQGRKTSLAQKRVRSSKHRKC